MSVENGPRILVIDDSAGTRRLLCRILGAAGVRAEACGDGRAGLESFRSRRYDLVITDLHMPRMDGIEVIRRILELAPSTPIIAISGCSSEGCGLAGARASGAVAAIPKPVDPERLLRAVSEAMQRLPSASPDSCAARPAS